MGGEPSAQANRVVLCGKLVELDILRHTPGGVPILKFRIEHESDQVEAGEKLVTVYASTSKQGAQAIQQVLEAHTWSDTPVPPLPMFYGVVD